MTEVGDRLRQAREAKGLNQSELAEKLGLTQASISQFEKGQRRPTPAMLTRMAEALEVGREVLAGKSEGQFEQEMLMRNLQGLSPDALRKINELVTMIKQGDKPK